MIFDAEIRWRDDLAERISIMESEGVPDATVKAMADIQRCREREENRQAGLWENRE